MTNQKLKSSYLLLAGYIILILSLIILDQSTKFHAEKAFMVTSHPTEVHAFTPSEKRILNFGISPAVKYEMMDPEVSVSNNWLDFSLTYVRNTGVAWGFLSNIPAGYRLPFFSTITLIAIGVILFLFKSTPPQQVLARTAFMFILSGALGNFTDRILLGYVIDWLHFHWKIAGWEYNFPVFNVADIAINIGIGLMLIDLIITETFRRKQHES